MKKLLSIALFGALVVGCQAERHAEIPTGASLVAEGNNRISYTAPGEGMVWVYNKGNGHMEYAGRVTRGDMVLVDPDADKISVNGRNVNDKPLTTLDDKRIFFLPESAMTATERQMAPTEVRKYYDANGRLVEEKTTTPAQTQVQRYQYP